VYYTEACNGPPSWPLPQLSHLGGGGATRPLPRDRGTEELYDDEQLGHTQSLDQRSKK